MVLHCTYLSSLCIALCSAAYVNVERAPICHWAACTTAKQYLVSGFNYRFACVCIYTWLTKVEVFCSPSYPLWTIHLLPSLSLSPLSFFLSFFSVPSWHVLLSALLSATHLKCLAYLLKEKAFSLPCLSHGGPFTKYFCFPPPWLIRPCAHTNTKNLI